MVHCASHTDAILHALQLFLDVLWGRPLALGSRRRLCERQCGDENLHIYRMGPAHDLCRNLQLHEIRERKWEQVVSFIDSFTFRVLNGHFVLDAGSMRVTTTGYWPSQSWFSCSVQPFFWSTSFVCLSRNFTPNQCHLRPSPLKRPSGQHSYW